MLEIDQNGHSAAVSLSRLGAIWTAALARDFDRTGGVFMQFPGREAPRFYSIARNHDPRSIDSGDRRHGQ
jgi:hypothetical protein